MTRRRLELVLFAAPLLFLVALALFKLLYKVESDTYFRLVAEDGPVEYASFLALWIGAALSGLTAVGALRANVRLGRPIALFHVCFGLFLVFLGLEEISYGQRILGFETPPALAVVNTQGEFNLHNLSTLKWIVQDIVPGLVVKYGLFGWLLRMVGDRLSYDGIGIRPLPAMVFPPWYVAPWFLPFGVWCYVGVCCAARTFIVWQDQEPAEMVLAIGFMLFSWSCWRGIRNLS
jgi:hypothetical protein